MITWRSRCVLLLALLPLAIPFDRAGYGQSLPQAEAARVDGIFAPANRPAGPGCAVGITRNGTTIFERGYGRANIENALAITPASVFEIGSMTKQFTAMAIALLADAGRLTLDDDVRRYVPELSTSGTPTTLRQLLHHTSGVREVSQLLAFAGWRYPEDLVTQADAIGMVARQRGTNFPPGESYAYSNSGYVLLALVVERVSGQSYATFLADRIFRPLGMTHTTVHDRHAALVPGRAWAYSEDAGGWTTFMPVADYVGHSGIVSTVGDMLLWLQNFDRHLVGGPTWWNDATTPGRLNSGAATTYGFGLFVGQLRGAVTWSHSGSTAGYTSDQIWFPAQKIGVVTLCNASTPSPTNLGRQVASTLLDSQLAPAPAAASAAPNDAVVPASELTAAAGAYKRLDSDVATAFEVRAGRLVYAHSGAPLTPLGSGRFLYRSSGAILEFGVPVDGAPGLVVKRDGVIQEQLIKMPAPAITPEFLTAYTGDYDSAELQTTYRIAVDAGRLIVSQTRAPDRPLLPLWADAFMGFNGLTLRFDRDPTGRVVGLRISNALARNVAFARTSR